MPDAVRKFMSDPDDDEHLIQAAIACYKHQVVAGQQRRSGGRNDDPLGLGDEDAPLAGFSDADVKSEAPDEKSDDDLFGSLKSKKTTKKSKKASLFADSPKPERNRRRSAPRPKRSCSRSESESKPARKRSKKADKQPKFELPDSESESDGPATPDLSELQNAVAEWDNHGEANGAIESWNNDIANSRKGPSAKTLKEWFAQIPDKVVTGTELGDVRANIADKDRLGARQVAAVVTKIHEIMERLKSLAPTQPSAAASARGGTKTPDDKQHTFKVRFADNSNDDVLVKAADPYSEVVANASNTLEQCADLILKALELPEGKIDQYVVHSLSWSEDGNDVAAATAPADMMQSITHFTDLVVSAKST